jgi:hypothetical protein
MEMNVCKCTIDFPVFLVNGLAFTTLAALVSAFLYAVYYLLKIQIYNSRVRDEFPTPCRTPVSSEVPGSGIWRRTSVITNTTTSLSSVFDQEPPTPTPLRELQPPPTGIICPPTMPPRQAKITPLDALYTSPTMPPRQTKITPSDTRLTYREHPRPVSPLDLEYCVPAVPVDLEGSGAGMMPTHNDLPRSPVLALMKKYSYTDVI